MKKIFICVTLITALFIMGCSKQQQSEVNAPVASVSAVDYRVQPVNVLQLDDLVTISVLENNAAEYGIEPNPPGGGGEAFYVSNAKVPGQNRYEILFTVNNPPIDALVYSHFVFEIMGDSFDVINDLHGIYPRFRNNDIYTQFEGTTFLRGVINGVLIGRSQIWITISVPILPYNIQENPNNYEDAMSNMNMLLARFTSGTDVIPGRIYFKNLRLQDAPGGI